MTQMWTPELCRQLRDRVDYKKNFASQNSRRRLDAVDRTNGNEMARVLYRYGDCILFAAALTEHFTLEMAHICRVAPEQPLPDGWEHSVAKHPSEDIYADVLGERPLKELLAAYPNTSRGIAKLYPEQELSWHQPKFDEKGLDLARGVLRALLPDARLIWPILCELTGG